MVNDVVLNKIATIERCLKRIHEEYDTNNKAEFNKNYTKQDSVILNLERASQATIDIATHIIRIKKLGLPKTSRALFDLLTESQIISKQSCIQMQSMVGFRNIAVHDYQKLNMDIVVSIIEQHLVDFEVFISEVFIMIKQDL